MTSPTIMQTTLFLMIGAHFLVLVSSRYTDCGSSAEIMEVSVNRCGDKDRCPLVRGQKTTIDIKFRTNNTMSSLIPKVAGKLRVGPFIPFVIKEKNACSNSGLQCPMQPGVHVYHSEIDVRSEFPALNVLVKWELKENKKSKENLVCVHIPSVITDAL